MTFKLEISLDNAAFDDCMGPALAHVLTRFCERELRDCEVLEPGDNGTFTDANGNTIGTFEVVE